MICSCYMFRFSLSAIFSSYLNVSSNLVTFLLEGIKFEKK